MKYKIKDNFRRQYARINAIRAIANAIGADNINCSNWVFSHGLNYSDMMRLTLSGRILDSLIGNIPQVRYSLYDMRKGVNILTSKHRELANIKLSEIEDDILEYVETNKLLR